MPLARAPRTPVAETGAVADKARDKRSAADDREPTPIFDDVYRAAAERSAKADHPVVEKAESSE